MPFISRGKFLNGKAITAVVEISYGNDIVGIEFAIEDFKPLRAYVKGKMELVKFGEEKQISLVRPEEDPLQKSPLFHLYYALLNLSGGEIKGYTQRALSYEREIKNWVVKEKEVQSFDGIA